MSAPARFDAGASIRTSPAACDREAVTAERRLRRRLRHTLNLAREELDRVLRSGDASGHLALAVLARLTPVVWPTPEPSGPRRVAPGTLRRMLVADDDD